MAGREWGGGLAFVKGIIKCKIAHKISLNRISAPSAGDESSLGSADFSTREWRSVMTEEQLKLPKIKI